METVFTVFAVVVLTVILTLGFCHFALSAPTDTQEENADPCATCLRWSECNGVEMETCPLWEVKRNGKD